MHQIHKLKTTGEEVKPLPWIGQDAQPWPQNYMRVMIIIPGRHWFSAKKARIQTIHKDKIITEKA